MEFKFNFFNKNKKVDLKSLENIEKQTKWNETLSKVEKITDKLGKRVDPGIKEAVAAFMVNGFETSSSCEGHLDRGRPYPSVMINNRIKSAEFHERATSLINKIKSKGYKNFKDIKETDTELYPEFIELRTEAEKYEKDVENKIKSLLSNFYSFHKPLSKDYTLIPWKGGSFFYVSSISGAGTGLDNWKKFELKIESMSLEEKKNYLKNSQDEMKAFTEFLKNKFLNY